MSEKTALLEAAARRIVANRQNPLVFGGALQQLPDGTRHNPRGIQLLRWPSGEYTRRQPSYLVGRISIRPGMYADRALNAYGKNDAINLAQLVAAAGWEIPDGKVPEIVREGDALTFVIPWPEHLQNNDAPLTSLDGLQSIWKRGRFVVGPDTAGDLFTPEFGPAKTHSGIVHHALVGGASGSGKTWFLRSLAYQIAHHKDARSVIIDFKGGDGIGYLRNIPGQVGPTVINDLDAARNALAWFYNECLRRYRVMENAGQTECTEPPLYLFFSEFTAVTATTIGVADSACIFMLANLAQKARGANMHLILDTQYPRGDVFGDTTVRKQFDFTMCFRTSDQYDTQALLPPGMGLRPYLTLSNAPGDGYGIIGSEARRVLTAYVPENELRAMRDSAKPLLDEWPEYDDLPGLPEPRDRGQPVKDFSASDIAAALVVLRRDGDKRRMLRAELGSLSNDRSGKLLALARELEAELEARDYCGVRPSA